MRELAPRVWQLGGFPPNLINAYLAGDVLIDAKTRHDAGRIVKALRGRPLQAHAITHAHPDHQGASKHVCETFGVPFWAPERDADAAEDPRLIGERQPSNPIAQLFVTTMTGPGHPVDRRLQAGDDVAGFSVIDAPGHSRGHVVLWRAGDGVLIVGDVLASMNPLTMWPGLTLPLDLLTPDPAQARASARRLAELGEPSLVLFGHGPPLRDGPRFRAFCAAL